ncbi:hypothetical protein CHRY9293_03328 [Chryseobacterium potabilaquae]|uniref:Uncharacterized protein n=2 Tax=Chryseobacterium potabilaquae TaxID=2675057 RepID=A0A6N4X844_9FLAO|nr:hypothetical protein CHRY9293_03328 [Chryseobacterium potabilaquae]
MIAATALASIMTIIMSFKTQEKIEIQSKETPYSIEKEYAISKNAKNLSIFSAANAVTAVYESGYSNANNEIAKNSPANAEIAKVSQFD